MYVCIYISILLIFLYESECWTGGLECIKGVCCPRALLSLAEMITEIITCFDDCSLRVRRRLVHTTKHALKEIQCSVTSTMLSNIHTASGSRFFVQNISKNRRFLTMFNCKQILCSVDVLIII